jgi:uncharacterized membrane protein YdjX (TVP38/TMEM64 family)
MSLQALQPLPGTGFRKIVATVGVALCLAALVLWATAPAFLSEAELNDWIERAPGAAGPALIVAAIAITVVASPIPGGPVAMAAGAFYGVVFGGILTLAGAFLGALFAFSLSRILGHGALKLSSLRSVAWIARPRSQSSLMLLVFGSRLIPFVSFDAVSYAAGLTSLTAGRFALATFLGIAPSSFAFAALGKGVSVSNDGTVVALVAATTILLPAVLVSRRAVARAFCKPTVSDSVDQIGLKQGRGMVSWWNQAFAEDSEKRHGH